MLTKGWQRSSIFLSRERARFSGGKFRAVNMFIPVESVVHVGDVALAFSSSQVSGLVALAFSLSQVSVLSARRS